MNMTKTELFLKLANPDADGLVGGCPSPNLLVSSQD